MPSFCAVINCNDRYGHSENISFHKFPLKRIDLLKQWEAFIQKQRGPDWHASRWSSLCSRHFREQDFRSLNERKTLKKSAVPTIMVTADVQERPNKKLNEHVSTESRQKKEALAIQGIKERLEEVGNAAKSHCRLCGFYIIPAATFQSNYKLFGILQKCLPTLNIQQEDTLPKTVCATCLKNLQQFGNFVDKIVAAQEELLRKYRQRTSEKALKIKQEPVVRVKQEAAEADNNQELQRDLNYINNEDYDCTGEQPPHGDTSDQKYDFCDFPIMSDCDITEIINVNDPFISIPDDDTTSLNMETEQLQQPQQQLSNKSQPTEGTHPHHLFSAHDLLQSHLLMEEHNYAYIETEDFKEESCIYKTEKTEGYEQSTPLNITALPLDEIFEINNSTTTNDATQPLPQSAFSLSNDNRAHKPIVTSVSAIQQPSKPNGIVVLNESIVKSGTGFQLHACMVCQMKFFSIEALRQHYTQTHGTPMVGVPNIYLGEAVGNACKMENETNETNETSTEHTLPNVINKKNTPQPMESTNSHLQETNNIENEERPQPLKMSPPKNKIKQRRKSMKRHINSNLNIMATHYQQLKKLYHKLQRKCLNLEQNVEQLQLQPKENLRKVKKKCITEPFTLAANKIKKPQCPNHLPNDSKFECNICLKVFSNANSLRQHKITHTEERKHICGLCSRSFKRRNGLLQHFKGFHLQVKPFSCAVCKHAYALKCDMLRCKHSVLKNGQHQ